MINGYKIITLCGSTKFKEEYEEVNKELTLKGNIVLSCPIFHHSDNLTFSDKEISLLTDIHIARIDLCDEIFVINKNGYIGQSTKEEIEYARSINKKINYLEPIISFYCRKCGHTHIFINFNIPAIKNILNKPCPTCGEESYENWIYEVNT